MITRSANSQTPDDARFTIAPASWRDFRDIYALERVCFPHDPWPWIDVLAALTFPDTVRLKAIPSGMRSAIPSGIPKDLGTGVRSAIPSGMRSAIPSGMQKETPRPPPENDLARSGGTRPHAIGFVIGDRRRLQRLGWVASIGVHPAFRRRGVGARLLASCEEELGTPRVRLTLRPSNLAARRLYEAAGYVEIGTLSRYYLDGEDGIMMEKAIKG